MIKNSNPVSVKLRVMNESSDIDAFWRVANSWANRDSDVFVMMLIRDRLVEIVGQGRTIFKRNIDTFAERPGTLDATN